MNQQEIRPRKTKNRKASPKQPEPARVIDTRQSVSTTEVTPEERHHLIAKAAYHRAERRGFIPGFEQEDWFEAENEVENQLGKTQADQLSKHD